MIRSAHRQEILRSAWRISPMSTIPTHNALYLCISEHLTPLGRRASVSLHRPPPASRKCPPLPTHKCRPLPRHTAVCKRPALLLSVGILHGSALDHTRHPTSRESKLRSSAYGGASPQLRQRQRPQQPDPSPQWWQHRPHPCLPAAQRYCRHYYYCCR